MSKTARSLVGILLIISTFVLMYSVNNILYNSDEFFVSNSDILYLLMIPTGIIITTIAAWMVVLYGKRTLTTSQLLRNVCCYVFGAVALTAAVFYVPLPDYSRACCSEVHTTRIRGLPIAYAYTEGSASLFDDRKPMTFPDFRFFAGWIIIDIAEWTSIIAYTHRLLLLNREKKDAIRA